MTHDFDTHWLSTPHSGCHAQFGCKYQRSPTYMPELDDAISKNGLEEYIKYREKKAIQLACNWLIEEYPGLATHVAQATAKDMETWAEEHWG